MKDDIMSIELTQATQGVKAIVCGGRSYADKKMVFAALDYYHRIYRFSMIIHGEATGADTLAKQWAISRGVPQKGVKPKWGLYGNMAGNVRNQKMINDYDPSLVIAFPGRSGTADMVERAEFCGIKVLRGNEWDAIDQETNP